MPDTHSVPFADGIDEMDHLKARTQKGKERIASEEKPSRAWNRQDETR